MKHFSLLLLVLFIAASSIRADDPKEPTAPDGCHWRALPAVKMHLAVPDGWELRDTSEKRSFSFEVRPAGPGFENSKTRYLLVVKRHQAKSEVVKMARDYVESLRSAGTEVQPLDEQAVGVMTFFSSFATYKPEVPGATALAVGILAAANAQTGTLYTVRFNIPVEEQDEVAPLGNKLFQTMRIDDEF